MAKLVSVKNLVTSSKKKRFITDRYYQNGEQDNYPNEVEKIIKESVTASSVINRFDKYVFGKGLKEKGDQVINKNQNLNEFLKSIIHSYTRYNGVFIHVNYNLEFKIISAKVLPFAKCRVGKQDDTGYTSKIYFKKEKKVISYDVFNPNPDAIKLQIEEAENINRYKGQIYFYNPSEEIYPTPIIDAVLNDAESEGQVSVYKKTSLTRGFFGKQLIITPPMASPQEYDEWNLPDVDSEEYKLYEKQNKYIQDKRDTFRSNIKSFMGAKNTGGVMHIELEFDGDKIEDSIKFVKIDTEINDKMFAHTEQSVKDNIMTRFQVPAILLNARNNAVFSNSGEFLKQAKMHYQEITTDDRMNVESIINLIYKYKSDFSGEKLEIIKLFQDESVNQQS